MALHGSKLAAVRSHTRIALHGRLDHDVTPHCSGPMADCTVRPRLGFHVPARRRQAPATGRAGERNQEPHLTSPRSPGVFGRFC
jgi:hypothetical protein